MSCEFKSTLIVAPNPSKGITTINYSTYNENSTIELYSVLGRLITTHETNNSIGSWQLDTTTIPSGIYIVVLKDNNGIQMQQKLIVE